MTSFNKVDKILAALGSIKAMERLHVDTFTEDKVKTIKGDKFAESKEGILLGTFENLNGYDFFEASILSRLDIKTLKGATLHFKGETDFILTSDTQEIESDFSNVSNQFMTKISFDISEKEIEMINNRSYDNVVFSFKKKSLTWFKV